MDNIFDYELILKRIIDSVNEQLDLAIPEFLERIRVQLEERYQIAIQEFYSAYTPKEYIRRESLKHLLNTNVEANGKKSKLICTFDDFFADNDGTNLFSIVFMEGNHGGREPRYTYWGHSPVFMSTPPIQLFVNEVNKYANFAAQFDFEAVWSKYAANIRI